MIVQELLSAACIEMDPHKCSDVKEANLRSHFTYARMRCANFALCTSIFVESSASVNGKRNCSEGGVAFHTRWDGIYHSLVKIFPLLTLKIQIFFLSESYV